MTLSTSQRTQLEQLGVEVVSGHLLQAGPDRGTAITWLGDMNRGDVEDWLAEQGRKAGKLQAQTLYWVKASVWIGIAGILVAIGIAAIPLIVQSTPK
jgi:hypothetical protein